MGFVRMVQKCQQIDRFVLEDMIKRQSVAEHSFNVALMAWSFARWSNKHELTSLDETEVLMRGLLHDAPETLTGDLNYWVKQEPGVKELWNRVEHKLVREELENEPEWLQSPVLTYALGPPSLGLCRLIKMCDYIDFTLFCQREHFLGNQWAWQLMEHGMLIILDHTDPFWLQENTPLDKILQPIYMKHFRDTDKIIEKYKLKGGEAWILY